MPLTAAHATAARSLALLLGATILVACAGSGDASTTDESTATPPSSAGGAPGAQTQAATLASAGAIDTLAVATWKTPTCGCCSQWVEYMRKHGYRVSATDVANVAPVKRQHGLPEDMESCHTSLIGGYVVEGHVPVEDIRRMLAERPDIIGIAAPGMPQGSPGMETGIVQKYNVMAIGKDGSKKVWSAH